MEISSEPGTLPRGREGGNGAKNCATTKGNFSYVVGGRVPDIPRLSQ